MGIFSRLISKISGGSSDVDWSDIERELLLSDLGRELTLRVINSAKNEKTTDVSTILQGLLSDKSRALAASGVVMVVGVNGTGKTTSCAKLAYYLRQEHKKVLLAAADTFRAAAVDQLETWGSRLEVEVVTGKGDSAAVAFDATARFIDSSSDYLIIDTAGRLHTKSDLMDELGKVKRVIEKRTPVTEVLLVIDGTTGQNGIAQAKTFAASVDVTGVIVTKVDGSARGGIALAIESELDIPIKFVGTGEGSGDFAPFNAQEYIQSLLT